jgi:plastocyanin
VTGGRSIRSVAIAVVLAATAAACGGAAANVTPPPSADASVTAQSGSFSPGEIDLPTDQPVEIFFRNLDPADHNVAIYRDASAADKLFEGDAINNASTTYEVPPLPAGRYVFRCDVHPNMTGTVVVGG